MRNCTPHKIKVLYFIISIYSEFIEDDIRQYTCEYYSRELIQTSLNQNIKELYISSNFNFIIEKYANLESIYACWSQRNRVYDPSQPSKLTVK